MRSFTKSRPTRHEAPQVIGLLFVKDLILLDPEDELPVRNIIDTFHHDLTHLDVNTSVKAVMTEFLHGRSHLAIVQEQIGIKTNGDIIYENVGIVTLEDIIENILKMEIEDEFDLTSAVATNDKSRNDDILQLFDYRRTRGMDGMPPQEKLVVYRHLCREVEAFMPQYRAVEAIDLQNLLAAGSVTKIIEDTWQELDRSNTHSKANLLIEDGGHLLYSKGTQSQFFTFILDGKAEVYSGRQKFRSEAARFTIFCPELLSLTQRDYKEGLEFSAFVPDFTARVIQNSRILRISRETFHKCLQGKLRNYSRPHKETKDKFREISQRSILRRGVGKPSSYTSFTQLSNYELKAFSNYNLKAESDMYLRKSFERNMRGGEKKIETETLESEEHLGEPESSDCVI